jgi:hypothetical protein
VTAPRGGSGGLPGRGGDRPEGGRRSAVAFLRGLLAELGGDVTGTPCVYNKIELVQLPEGVKSNFDFDRFPLDVMAMLGGD